MLRARNSVARRALHPAESARTCTARRTDLGSSPTWWPAPTIRAGSCPIRRVEHSQLIGDRVRRHVARPQQPSERFASGVRRNRTSVRTRTHACSSRPCLPCSRNGCRPATRRDPRPPGALPVVAEDRRHTCARVSAIAFPAHPGTPRRSIGSCNTTSSPTPPPRTELAGRAALRYRCTPPRHQPASTSPAPTPCPDHGTATGAEEPAPTATRPTRGGPPGTPTACNPTCATTCSPPPSTTTATVLLAFTCEVPSCWGICCSRQAQFPLPGGLLHGRATLSSPTHVNDRG